MKEPIILIWRSESEHGGAADVEPARDLGLADASEHDTFRAEPDWSVARWRPTQMLAIQPRFSDSIVGSVEGRRFQRNFSWSFWLSYCPPHLLRTE